MISKDFGHLKILALEGASEKSGIQILTKYLQNIECFASP